MKNNTQSPSPVEITSDLLRVHSIWPTIQGEGSFAGRPATFVRLKGCNLQCPWCDTDYTSAERSYFLGSTRTMPELTDLIDDIAAFTPLRVRNHARHLVVITGGEPFRQPLDKFTRRLLDNGFDVQVETNGTLYQELDPAVVVVCSPKTPAINENLARRANAFKYVIDAAHVDPEDGLPAGTLGKFTSTARPPEGFTGQVFVQPLDAQDEMANRHNLEAAVDSVMRFGYVLSIQMHKIAKVA